MPEQHPLRQFLLLVFPLMLPFFAIWTFASAPLALPAIGFDNMILTTWLPEIVEGVYVQGPEALLMTRFGDAGGQIVPAGQAEAAIGFSINTRILSYSIPFYAALHFATPRKDYLGDFFVGVVVLYALLVFGLVCLSLKDMMVVLGATFLEHPEASVPPANVIGLLYQLNVLLVPTLGPILLWAWQNRDSGLLRGMLGQAPVSGDDTPGEPG
jgi:hypothetical protein